MSYQSNIQEAIAARRLDVALAVVGCLLSIALLGLELLVSNPLVMVIPLSTGTACVLYLATQNQRMSTVEVPAVGHLAAGYLPSLVVFGLAGFVALVWTAGERTMLAYLLAGGIGTVILVQILLLDDERLDPATILVQVFAVALVVRLAGLFVTPGYVGVDIWTHLPVYVQGIVDTGSFAAMDGSKYLMAPIYHSFAAIATFLFGSPRMGVYLTLGLLVPLSVLFVYGTGTMLMPTRWALLATTLFVFSEHAIEWGMHIIPTSLGLVFFLAIFYCVTRLFMNNAEGWVVAMLGLFAVAFVFTHQLSTAIMLVFLGISTLVAFAMDVSRGWPVSARLSRKAAALGSVFLGALSLTTLSWAYTPHSGDSIFLWETIRTTRRLFAQNVGFLNLAGGDVPAYASAGQPSLVGQLVPYVELVGFGLLLCIAVIGGLVMLRWDRPFDVTLTHQLTAAVLFLATFGFSLFGFRAFLPGRWLAFLYVPLALIGAMGMYYVFQTASRRTILAAVLVLAVAYPATMVISEEATLDSPAFEDEHPRFSFTQSEVAAVHTIGAIHPATLDSVINTDHPYIRLFAPVGGFDDVTLQVGADGAVSDNPVVYREYQSSGPVSVTVPGEVPRTFYTRSLSQEQVCSPTRNVAYANDRVLFCTQTGVTEGVGS